MTNSGLDGAARLSRESTLSEILEVLHCALEGYTSGARVGADPGAGHARSLLGVRRTAGSFTVYALTEYNSSPLGIGPHFRHAKCFSLYEGLRGQRLESVRFDAKRRVLSIQVHRDKRARQFDRSPASQKLDLELGPEGTLHSVRISTAGRLGRIFGAYESTRFIPGTSAQTGVARLPLMRPEAAT